MIKSRDLYTEIGASDYVALVAENLSEIYDSLGRYKESLFYYKKAVRIKDTLFSQENKKQLISKELNYEFEKKEAAEKASHDKEMAVSAAERKKQLIIIIFTVTGLLLVIIFAGFIFRSLKISNQQKNIIEAQKNEVTQQKETAEKQKEISEKQKEKIVDSINYAQYIQKSILKEENEIRNFLPDSFIYYLPKDIVSGDFYWFSKIEHDGKNKKEDNNVTPTPLDYKLIIAAVDCTGHGVPGAFMSMIGNTLLNQIVNENHITEPAEILRLLNIGIHKALNQGKDGALSLDGMDIALCTIDYKSKEIQYAGAQNPLFVFSSDKGLDIIKGDLNGIGGNRLNQSIDPEKKTYTNHLIPLQENMCLYLFSDGYMDQFEERSKKKFGLAKFKELLLNSQHLKMREQKKVFASALQSWKGNSAQIDDILVIGIRL